MEGPSLFLAKEQLKPFKKKVVFCVSGTTSIEKGRFKGQIVKDIFRWGKHSGMLALANCTSDASDCWRIGVPMSWPMISTYVLNVDGERPQLGGCADPCFNSSRRSWSSTLSVLAGTH